MLPIELRHRLRMRTRQHVLTLSSVQIPYAESGIVGGDDGGVGIVDHHFGDGASNQLIEQLTCGE